MSYNQAEFARLKKAVSDFIDASFDFFWEGDEILFEDLALDIFRFQFAYNVPYQAFCKSRNATPDTVFHWEQIPALITSAWKEFEVTILPPEERNRVFYSSGTTAEKRSQHFHSAESLEIYERSLKNNFRATFLPGYLGLNQKVSMNILCLTPPPAQVPHSSLVHMFDTLLKEHGTKASGFAGLADAGEGWSLNFSEIKKFIFSLKKGSPAMIMGTAFSLVHLCDFFREKKEKWKFPKETLVIETGGYKGRSRELPKPELHDLISTTLGISKALITCEYGMSELSSQAYDIYAGEGSKGFKFPPCAQARIVSPETGEEVPDGQAGLLQVFDLANIASLMAVQTEDLAIQRDGAFELLGRSAASEPRGCSLMNL